MGASGAACPGGFEAGRGRHALRWFWADRRASRAKAVTNAAPGIGLSPAGRRHPELAAGASIALASARLRRCAGAARGRPAPAFSARASTRSSQSPSQARGLTEGRMPAGATRRRGTGADPPIRQIQRGAARPRQRGPGGRLRHAVQRQHPRGRLPARRARRSLKPRHWPSATNSATPATASAASGALARHHASGGRGNKTRNGRAHGTAPVAPAARRARR